MRSLLGTATLAALAAPALPSPASWGPVRTALTPAVCTPALSGLSDRPHVALTFDDGPDRRSTPLFLRTLDRLGVRATFFVLGRHLADHGLVGEMAAAGHEVGVHGWDHRPASLHGPRRLRDDVARTRDLVEDATGRPVQWHRPPYGVITGASTWAAGQAGLRTVLWSAWGRDWERRATPSTVVALVEQQLEPGGTVLLHDSDRTSAPGSWRTTLRAVEQLVPQWLDRGLAVGPLADHWGGYDTRRSSLSTTSA
ncbi:polysaccharide deacetylase family protein [Nocardioides marmoribigeumensis]|uniref:Peptidoglycan/xylan/chitin deacetylase (PgdA/CDA1 family) n=1 Tax=Nocardioides marmoribigeumensis TaxID=433649 RepID=A0ABU2BTC8_9ACTN|nr:polysaccharide deacetylase family protein [Nocardioides marmoribigeumensis]MDR7361897.1 peptidoglycan/xylan/chitin deacetylase (PgdA/CDA1 family) [Nocardioides marmoribigeumensis]